MKGVMDIHGNVEETNVVLFVPSSAVKITGREMVAALDALGILADLVAFGTRRLPPDPYDTLLYSIPRMAYVPREKPHNPNRDAQKAAKQARKRAKRLR